MVSNAEGAGMSADVPGVIAAVNRISDANSQLNLNLRQLVFDAEAVIKGSWTGAAADSMHQGWSQWLSGMEKMIQALNQTNDMTIKAAQSLQSQDKSVTFDG